MITFAGKQIYGTHGIVTEVKAELSVQRTYYWGLYGMSEVVGSPQGRHLSCEIWLHKKYSSRRKLEEGIEEINGWIGEHGQLKERDRYNTQLTFNNVTFHGFQREPFGRNSGPVHDVTRTVDGGWVQSGTLHFYQLRQNDVTP